MFDDEEVFFYDEANDCVSSLSKYHAENCSIEPLVEAHPDVIYFYATFGPHKEWDFNEVAPMPLVDKGPHPYPYLNDPFNLGPHYESIFVNPDMIVLHSVSLDAEPNAFGESIEICTCPGAPYHREGCTLRKSE